MRLRRKTRLALSTAALALLLSSMGLDAAGEPKTHTIVIDAVDYAPKQLTVKSGDTIVWVNKDLYPHTVTAEDGSFDSGPIAGGKSWTHTVKAKGDVPYVCTLHVTMVGMLHVE